MNPVPAIAQSASRSTFALGIAAVLFGILAVAAPAFSGLAVTGLVGVLLVAGGITRSIFAFKADSFGEGAASLLIGAAGVVCGGVMLAQPVLGLQSLTLVLAAYFVFDGIMSLVSAYQLRKEGPWGWSLFAGLTSLVLAWMIASEWPLSGAWAVGVLVGVHLMISGFQVMFLGSMGDAIAEEVDEEIDDAIETLAREVAAEQATLQSAAPQAASSPA